MKFTFSLRDVIWLFVVIIIAIAYFSKNDNKEEIKQLQAEIDSLNIIVSDKEEVIKQSQIYVKRLEGSLDKKQEEIENQEKREKNIIEYYEKNRNNYVNLDDDSKIKFLSKNIGK